MKVVLYARVSSEKQAENDLSISAQLKALRKYAAERDCEVLREFVDEAQSARSADRPAFQEMIALAKQRRKVFDSILVWKLSRFARNREDSIIYKSLLRKNDVNVISINEKVDDTPAGKLLEGMIEVIDEFYSTNLGQDTIRGMKENAGRGYYNGGTVPIGYKAQKVQDGASKKTQLALDEAFAPIVRRIYRMFIEGMGAKGIAKTLNAEGLKTNRGKSWSNNQVYRIIKNETYAGTLVWNKQSKRNGRSKPNDPEEVIRVEDNHPAIVDQQTFERAQELLIERSPKLTHPRTVNSDYILAKLLYCGKCGLKMVGCSAKSSQFFYYACQNYRKRGKHVCDAKSINKDTLESFVIDRVRANILTEENLTELVRMTNEEISQASSLYEEQLAVMDGQLEDLRGRLHRLYDALETGKLEVGDLAPRITALKSQIDELQNRRFDAMTHAGQFEPQPLDYSTVKTYVDDLKDLLSKGSIMEQKSFLRSFVKRIELDLPQVVIDYTVPLPTRKAEPLSREVLPITPSGSPGRIRTTNQPVNSRLLYR